MGFLPRIDQELFELVQPLGNFAFLAFVQNISLSILFTPAQKIFNPRLLMGSILVSPISKASAEQRSGRAGRTQNGVCYRLYTEESFKQLPENTPPQIRSNKLGRSL